MKLFLLELNEFNEDLLYRGVSLLSLPHLRRLLELHRSETLSPDDCESAVLEPWVQWVSVHTGVPFSVHGVKHLGDAPALRFPQIWEELSQQGITSGIWGAMNGKRNDASRCLFFLPDPWTASEEAFPMELSALLTPLRALSKNYTSTSQVSSLAQLIRLFRLFHSHQQSGFFVRALACLGLDALRFRWKPFVFVSALDALSARLFLAYKSRYSPDFSLFFLNSLAHLQHHQWRGAGLSAPLVHGLKIIDRILGDIFAALEPGEELVVTNALSQKNTEDEKPWILYRQLDQRQFLRAIGLRGVHVEAHMTHDAHLFFSSPEAALAGAALLRTATVDNQPLFSVEMYPQEPTKLFYKIAFTDFLPDDARLFIGDQSYPFFSLFRAIVRRTGRHIPRGTLFSTLDCFPKQLANHQIVQRIIALFSREGQKSQVNEPCTFQSR